MSDDTLLLRADAHPDVTAPTPNYILLPSTPFFLDYTEFRHIRAEGMCGAL